MKTRFLSILLTLSALLPAAALAVFTYSGSPYAIPDGNRNGVWSSVPVSGEAPKLTDVRVTLNVNGGYNGDLYAYLSFQGRLMVLLNRVGMSSTNLFGADGAGMSVTLTDSAPANIHAAGNGYLSGAYRADGQNVDPLSNAGSFSASGGTITLNERFGGLNPNGDWTLFVADVLSGGGASTVNGWELSITAIPEPNAMELAASGLILLSVLSRRRKP